MSDLAAEERIVIIILLALGLAVGALLWWQGRTESGLAWEAGAAPGPGDAPETPGPVGGSSAAVVETPLVVHVAGAVLHPGVYSLDEGSRVIDAVQAAGGVTGRADVDVVNLARAVADGEQVYIPTREQTRAGTAVGGGWSGAGSGAWSGTGSGGAGSGWGGTNKVNLNTATQVQLEALPGIGPALAVRIIEYRTQHGPFSAPEELLSVSGIGDKKLAELLDLITAP